MGLRVLLKVNAAGRVACRVLHGVLRLSQGCSEQEGLRHCDLHYAGTLQSAT